MPAIAAVRLNMRAPSVVRIGRAIAVTCCALLAGQAGPALSAAAADAAVAYPNRPIRIITPAQPGGTTDYLARLLATRFTEAWKQQAIVDNRGSASGVNGAEITKNAAPDGYTLMFASSSGASTSSRRQKGEGLMRKMAKISASAVSAGREMNWANVMFSEHRTPQCDVMFREICREPTGGAKEIFDSFTAPASLARAKQTANTL